MNGRSATGEATIYSAEKYRRQIKAKEIIADPTHPQHVQMVNLVDTALALDPPSGWRVEDTAS